jgi:serine/threonine-protein kinase
MTTPVDGFPVEDELHSTDRVIRWASHPPTPVEETTLSTKESALLDFLRAEGNQNLTPSQILSRSPLSDEETLAILGSLIASGVLELKEPSHAVDLSLTLAGTLQSTPAEIFGSTPVPRKLGRFEVDRLLGRGSMGAVLLAKDPAIDRVVAIKLVQTDAHLTASQRDKYRERFYREASAAGQLHHPAIATVFDVGHTEDGTPFLVMEHVKGETLRELLERGRPPLADTLRIARDVLAALSFAHDRGIVHRDVKPSNVMVTSDFRGKIMDFGIAHVMGSELTAGGDLLGSPYYMAPEQLAKGPITARTDLFSFAVVLYRMLTGVLPFTGDSFAAVAHAILHEKPAPLEHLDPGIPKAISSLVLRCLEKSPEERFGSAAEVLGALTAAESGKVQDFKAPKARLGRKLVLSFAFLLVVLAAVRIRAPEPSAAPIFATPMAPQRHESPVEPQPVASTRNGAARAPEARPAQSPPPARTEPPAPIVEKPVERRARPSPEREERKEPAPLSEADLFYQARVALERGDLEQSRARLEALLSRDPSFAGAAELYRVVTDQIWETRLPLLLAARHKHRLGGCEGELSLASLGVRFQSPDHDWAFRPEDIRVMERPEERTVIVETFERETLSLGKNKRYRFDLETPLSDGDWTRFQRLLK